MKKGSIVINAYMRLKSVEMQCRRLTEEFAKLGVQVDTVSNRFPFYIDTNGVKGMEFGDFCIFLDKDKYALKCLSDTGIKVFNSYKAITVCDDKLLTFLSLMQSGIKIPKTMAGLLCYDYKEPIQDWALNAVEERFSYPIIVKECFGSLGEGVHKVDNREQLTAVMERVKCKPHLFQEYVESSAGKDIRVIVAGEKALGAMLREGDGFRSNISLGGTASVYPLSDELSALAVSIAQKLDLDYCGIDFLIGKNGEYYLCEVNSNAFFGAFEKVTGVNVAKAYAEYVTQKVYG